MDTSGQPTTLIVWVNISVENANRLERVLREFGFASASPKPELFLAPNNVIRMGVPPVRIEILTSISGVDFRECYAEKILMSIDDVQVSVISLTRLREKINEQRGGRRTWPTLRTSRDNGHSVAPPYASRCARNSARFVVRNLLRFVRPAVQGAKETSCNRQA